MQRVSFPRLIVNNDAVPFPLAGARISKIPLKLLKSIDGERSARLHAAEKLAVVDYELAQARKRDAAHLAVALSIVQKLVAAGHCGPHLLTRFQYEGFSPRSSTGFFPHEESVPMRDNSLMSNLAERIQQRLDKLEITANAASDLAGLERGYITDIFIEAKDEIYRSPRTETLQKLAEALQCDFTWLSTGIGSPELDGDDPRRRLHKLVDELPDGDLEAAVTILGALTKNTQATG